MRAQIQGEIVDLTAEAYDMPRNDGGGNVSGVAYTAFVRNGPARFAPDRVRVEPVQYGALSVGQHVDWPVDITVSYGKLRCRLDADFVPVPGGELATAGPKH